MRKSIQFLQGSAVGVVMICAVAQRAVAITFNSVLASANADNLSSFTVSSTLPFVTPVAATTSDASSVVTPNATGLVYKGSFAQTTSSATAFTSGKFDLYFTAGAGDTYSLFGSALPTLGTGSLSVFLEDTTTNAFPYKYSSSLAGPGSIVADSTGGLTLGGLNGGDVYQFEISMGLSTTTLTTTSISVTPNAAVSANSLSGSGGITLVGGVPEPAMPCAMVIGGVVLLTFRRRRDLIAI